MNFLYAEHYHDSLRNEIEKREVSSKNAKVYYQLAKSFVYSNLDSSMIYSKKSLQSCNLAIDSIQLADVYHLGAYCALRMHKYDSAISLVNTSLRYYDTLSILDKYISSRIISINCYINQFKLAEAYEQYKLLEDVPNKSNLDRIRILDLYVQIFSMRKKPKLVLQKLMENLPFIDSVDQIPYKMKYFTSLGKAYFSEGETKNAIKYLLKSLKLADSIHNEYFQITIGNTIMVVYQDVENYKAAVPFAKRSIEFYKRNGDHQGYLDMQCQLAELYSRAEIVDSAKLVLSKISSEILEGSKPQLKMRFYKASKKYYEKTGQFQKALSAYENHIAIKDSIYNENSIKEVDGLRVQYEADKKEQENIILKQKLEIEKANKKRVLFSWIATSAFFVVFVFFSLLYRRNIEHRRALIKAINIQLEKDKKILEQENKLLESQKEIAIHKVQAQKNILTSTNNSLLQQSQLTSILIDALKGVRPYSNKKGQSIINSYLADLSNFSRERNWQTFEQNFVLFYPNFLVNLKEKYPSLTNAERRQCSFLKMGLSSSEISKITFQEKHSIYRLNKKIRDKIGVETNEKLDEIIKELIV